MALHQVEDGGIADHAILHCLEQTRAVFALRQGRQHVGIDQHRQRLMKRADKVFACLQIDAGLAADGRVNLCQQSCRNLHHRNATHESRREESADIADDSAAESEQYRVTICACAHHLFRQFLKLRERFCALAIGHDEEFQIALAEGSYATAWPSVCEWVARSKRICARRGG